MPHLMNSTHLARSCANRWKSHVNIQKTLLKPFHDVVIGPIVGMFGPQNNELVIFSDGVLCLAPWGQLIMQFYQVSSTVIKIEAMCMNAFYYMASSASGQYAANSVF